MITSGYPRQRIHRMWIGASFGLQFSWMSHPSHGWFGKFEPWIIQLAEVYFWLFMVFGVF